LNSTQLVFFYPVPAQSTRLFVWIPEKSNMHCVLVIDWMFKCSRCYKDYDGNRIDLQGDIKTVEANNN